MNIFDATKILGISDRQLAEKLRVSPRTFARYKQKIGEYAHVGVIKCPHTIDMFSHSNQVDEARNKFDFLWAQFVGQALQRKKKNK